MRGSPNACQNLNYREKLTTNIDYKIENEQFVSRSKDITDGVFTRIRKLPLKIRVHQFGPKADSPRSLALGSLLYDALNLVTIDSQIALYASSERALLLEHLEHVKPGDLLLLDRGYPSFWLLFLLKAKGIEFCVRLKEDWWLKVKDFTESSEKERIVTFALPKKDR